MIITALPRNLSQPETVFQRLIRLNANHDFMTKKETNSDALKKSDTDPPKQDNKKDSSENKNPENDDCESSKSSFYNRLGVLIDLKNK